MKTLTGKNKLPLPFKHDGAHVYHPNRIGKPRDNIYFGVELEYELDFPHEDQTKLWEKYRDLVESKKIDPLYQSFEEFHEDNQSGEYIVDDFEDCAVIRDHINKINKTVGRYGIIKDDGSLDYGIEIAAAPTTFGKQSKLWDKFFKNMAEFGLKSEESCGMHVHVSREGLTEDQIKRLCTFFAKLKVRAFMEKIAGRKQNQYCSYVHSEGQKYCAVNTDHDNTIEFRIFKAPKTKIEFLIRIQLVRGLISYSRDVDVMDLDEFKDYVKNTKTLKDLHSFIQTNNL